MKPVKIAMMGMTHGHTRKYYQTLLDNQKLDWVASCAQDADAKVWKAAWAKATKAARLAFAADKAKAAKTIAVKKGLDTNQSIKVAEVR